MRIAFLPDGTSVNAFYRSIGPMLALAERGHETRQLDPAQQRSWGETLRWCDVLHVHRVCDAGAVELAHAARETGAAVVWDDDDDVTRVPKGAGGYRDAGRLAASRRIVARRRLFEQVDLVTTPSEHLAGVFQEGGAREVAVIENYVIDRHLSAQPLRDGLTVGWVAAQEHRLDLDRVPIESALDQLLDRHPDVHVTTIGVALRLRSPRYRHVKPIPFQHLLGAVAGFEIGIAPLSPDVAINRSRSSIKIKEYAAVGIPWLASPIGPYAGLGEREGGRLVPDDRWFEELDALVCQRRLRRRLAKRAARWGRDQWLTRNADRWDRAFRDAIERSHRR